MNLAHPASVQVAHKNALIQAGICHILGTFPEFRVRSADATPRTTNPAEAPDILVLDEEEGVEHARGADSSNTAAGDNILIVAESVKEQDVRSALKCGVRGYIVVGCSAEEVVNAARAVAAGRRYLCATASANVADNVAKPDLTQRESAVLALMFRGHNNKEIARSLDISVGTVKCHMRGLMAKLGVRCRTEAAWVASRRGLIAPSA